jgi:uracil-DNA glycosylase family 4
MPLDLDERQRAMLQEMGVRVWSPGTEFLPAPAQEAVAALRAPVSTAPPVAQAPAQRMPAPESTAPVVMRAVPERAPLESGAMGALAALDWPALAGAAASCQACGLCAGRKNTTLCIPASSGQADWMVVGDPPDEDEDRAGQPFAQAAGVLMDNMLKAVGASRTGTGATGAYLTNVVKCRPPHGHIPQAVELAQCAAYLQREIALVQPKIILAMGRFATQLLLSEQPTLASLPLGKLRGTVYRYQGIAVVVTYHPKVLLRASADKAKAWADLCLAMQTL